MNRINNIWPELTSFRNLLLAARKACQGKRLRPDVAEFHFHLERNLLALQRHLLDHTYQHGPYRTFTIIDPKPRLISAAPYPDRVVHHALVRMLEPIFEPSFLFHSYACRKGKGTHRALDRFQQWAQRYRYVLKCDIRKYFPSIDRALLKEEIARRVKDRDVLWLVERIIDAANPQEETIDWFAGDDLFAPTRRRRGLPIGNQTSQFFANVFLNRFDHWVKQELRAPVYLRYVDDFVLLHDDRGWLSEARERIRERLAGQRLVLHPTKAVLSRVVDGTRLLGYRLFRHLRKLPRDRVVRLRRRLRGIRADLDAGRLTFPAVWPRLASWLGHVVQTRSRIFTHRLFEPMEDYWSPP